MMVSGSRYTENFRRDSGTRASFHLCWCATN